MKYANMLDEMYINKQANEDDDKDVVCNNCGKPMSIKNGPGCCTCNGGKGTSTKKEFLENELAKKLASEELAELYLEKQAEYSHNFKIPDDYDKYNIQDEIDFHNDFYESEGIKAPKFGKDLFPIAGNGGGDSYVVDKRNGKPTLKFFNHESPEKLQELSKGEKIDFGLVKFKPSERQRKLLNEGITSDKAVDSLKRAQLKSFAPNNKDNRAKNEAIENALMPPTAGFFIGTGIAAKKKLPEKQMAKAGLAGLALGTGVSLLANSKRKKDADNSLKKELKNDVWELQHRGLIKEKKASEVLDEMYKEAGIMTTTMAGMTGLGTGAMLGATAGNVRNKLTLDKDRKRLVQELKDARKERSKASNDAMNYENQIHEELGKKYKAYIMSMSPEKRKKLTVGDVEEFLSNNIPDFKKEASAEGVAFAAGAGLGAWTGYRCKTDKHTMQNTIKRHKDATAQHRASLTPEGKGKLRGSLLDYSPINTDMDRDEVNYYKDVLDGELKKQGINPNSMNLREYKGLMRNFINLDQKGEAENFDMYDPDHYARKAIDKHMSRLASEVLDEMYKEASGDKVGKWTNKDKKGFVRNMAINVAQDFVNAGNPLNVGSHIVGSVMDSALMEGMTMKMNKKLQAQKINQKSMNHFNDAKGLSNGTTAVKAVKSTPGAVKKITSGSNN